MRKQNKGAKKMYKIKDIVDCMNEAPSGGYVGIVDYESSNGDVVSVVGQLGCSYSDAKAKSIEALKTAIDENDFSDISVSGVCYGDKQSDGSIIWNARKRSLPLLSFNETFTKDEVLSVAKDILEAWENPAPRKSNKVQLTEKNDGLSFNTETLSFNFTLLVNNETYKEELSKKAKHGKEVKVKASAPESVLKNEIRKRFEKKIKSYSLSKGKFAKLSIGGKNFLSEEIAI
jgi:hypothetical protein